MDRTRGTEAFCSHSIGVCIYFSQSWCVWARPYRYALFRMKATRASHSHRTTKRDSSV